MSQEGFTGEEWQTHLNRKKEPEKKNVGGPPTPFGIATINNNLTTTNDIIRRNFYFEKIKKQKQNNVHPHPLPPPCGRFCPSPPNHQMDVPLALTKSLRPPFLYVTERRGALFKIDLFNFDIYEVFPLSTNLVL